MKKTNHGYVHIKTDVLGQTTQRSVATGKTRTRDDGTIEAEFVPINRGYYQEKFWASQDQIVCQKEKTSKETTRG